MGGDQENETETFGRITYRSRPKSSNRTREVGDAASLPDAFEAPGGSRTARPAYAYESFVPLRTENRSSGEGVQRPGSPYSETELYPHDLDAVGAAGVVPPLETPAENPSWFKSWLTSGILDVLGAAAGVTLSTTGKLVAPPLHLTKTILLPGLLALIVDTLDAITPPRVQDWFRIISSSVFHLMVVLGNTERGKIFSNQVYIVLQDILQAISAHESRQVLVDGMASSVKFAEALHTPEMMEFLEQLSTLCIRLLDAASSGKAKQLMQDTKDLAWKGIEMATDPATTLALAEVTAHLCHALEDTQQALNPTPRKQRNTQNQSVYLNPYQMADFPEQVTMEEVILSCLGRVEDNRREAMGDDGASLPSRLTLVDDLSATEPDSRDWVEKKEQVNLQLLREKILYEKLGKSRKERPPTIPTENDLQTTDQMESKDDISASVEQIDRQEPACERPPENDMEDIAKSCVPGGRRLGLKQEEKRKGQSDEAIPAVQQFYQLLDELLEEDRERLESRRTERDATTINNSLGVGKAGTFHSWKANMKKLRQHQKSRSFGQDKGGKGRGFGIPKKYHAIIIMVLAIGTFLSFVFSGFAMYGLYSLWKSFTTPSSKGVPSAVGNQDIVIRIVREIVHVAENGSILGQSEAHVLSQDDMNRIGETVASALR